MNRQVLAIRALRGTEGTEWRHRQTGAVTEILHVNDDDCLLDVKPVWKINQLRWPVLQFLKEFSPVPPPGVAPPWYQRLLDDDLV